MTDERPKRMALIAAHGGLDEAYPPLILASTGVAMEFEVGVFFTFYGLYILHKERKDHLKVAAVGNPAMPIAIPSMIGMLPGMSGMATGMMKKSMAKAGTATINELLDACVEFGVRMIACQMTMDVMGIKREDLIDGVEIGGAATFLEYASEADITLYM